MRMSVIGLPGSGKSTLASEVSRELDIPHIHIDRFWFAAGGRLDANPVEKDRVRAYVKEKVVEAIQQPAWVSDGLYARVQPLIAERADVIVFLDIPVRELLWNHMVRMFRRKSRHIELSIWNDIDFLREILYRRFRKGTLKKIQRIVEDNKEKTIVLRSRKEIARYLDSMRKESGA